MFPVLFVFGGTRVEDQEVDEAKSVPCNGHAFPDVSLAGNGPLSFGGSGGGGLCWT